MFKFVVLLSFAACALGASIPSGMLPQLDGRIVGGTETTISKFPYVVSLQKSGSHICGGSIYSTTVIVTAAHCLQNNPAVSSLKIRAGSTSRSSGGTLVAVKSYTNNPNYKSATKEYDIAVVRLSTALTLGANIAKIALATTTPAANTAATVCGWGVQSSGASASPTNLRYVDVKIISRATCASGTYSYGSSIKTTMLCAAATGKDACQGDSGGPLAAGGVLVGVVSWGYGCAESKYPGVYADVADLRTWVINNA